MEKVNGCRRVLLKLSGEILLGQQLFGICQKACAKLASNLARFHSEGFELGVVIGGGNIYRGVDLAEMGMPRTPADHMGMLATLFNAIAVQQALQLKGVSALVMSALECPKVAESYHWAKAQEALKAGKIVLFAGGTGNPYFTTDTAAALRASEMETDVLLKATKVQGVYDKDPMKHQDAIKYQSLSYSQVLAEKLQVMDAAAVALCRSGGIPVFVFHMDRLENEPLSEVLNRKELGTWIEGE